MTEFTDIDRQTLRGIARASISHGLTHRRPLPVDATRYNDALRQRLAVFVTLHLEGGLRGCIGNTSPVATLVEDTARNAHAAAFSDPRFPPVNKLDYPRLEIRLSVLTPAQTMTIANEADLLRQLRPGIDGLILKAGRHRSTFLPAVWEMLPDPKQFLAHLKLKAGLDADDWPQNIIFERYQSVTI